MVIFSIFIPGDVPSSKNSKIWTGKHLIHSKAARNYLSKVIPIFSNKKISKEFIKKVELIDLPYKITFVFIRGSKRKFDYVNMAQLPLDTMVNFGWIDDDNADCVIPYFKHYLYNKQHPGVIISVET